MNKITEWSVLEPITQEQIFGIESMLPHQQLKEMNKKMHELIGSMTFKDIKDRAFAEFIFKQGYLSAHCRYLKAEDLPEAESGFNSNKR